MLPTFDDRMHLRSKKSEEIRLNYISKATTNSLPLGSWNTDLPAITFNGRMEVDPPTAFDGLQVLAKVDYEIEVNHTPVRKDAKFTNPSSNRYSEIHEEGSPTRLFVTDHQPQQQQNPSVLVNLFGIDANLQFPFKSLIVGVINQLNELLDVLLSARARQMDQRRISKYRNFKISKYRNFNVQQYRYFTIFSGKSCAKSTSKYQSLRLLLNPAQLDPYMKRRYIKNTEDNPNGDGIIEMV